MNGFDTKFRKKILERGFPEDQARAAGHRLARAVAIELNRAARLKREGVDVPPFPALIQRLFQEYTGDETKARHIAEELVRIAQRWNVPVVTGARTNASALAEISVSEVDTASLRALWDAHVHKHSTKTQTGQDPLKSLLIGCRTFMAIEKNADVYRVQRPLGR